MTKETRTLIELSDVTAIEVECRDCKAKIVYPLAKTYDKIVQRCPNCNDDLFVLNSEPGVPPHSSSMENIRSIIKIVRALGKPGPDLKANIRLQVNSE